jgi:hypothetical protein
VNTLVRTFPLESTIRQSCLSFATSIPVFGTIKTERSGT